MTEIVQHQPTTALREQMEFASAVTHDNSASLLPDQYRGNRANVLIAVGLGASMGLSPAESLYRISVIKGKPAAGAELIAANVRKAGHKLRVRGDEQTCTAQIIRADDPDYVFEVTRDLAWAQRMGLADQVNYKKQPGTMLQWRAITAVARLACPEALYGVTYTPDELTDGEPVRTSRPAPTPQFTQQRPEQARPQEQQPRPAEQQPVDVSDAEVVGDEPDDPAAARITDTQRRAMFASFSEAGFDTDARSAEGKAARLAYIGKTIGREVTSTNDLTQDEASLVIDALKTDAQGQDEAEEFWKGGDAS